MAKSPRMEYHWRCYAMKLYSMLVICDLLPYCAILPLDHKKCIARYFYYEKAGYSSIHVVFLQQKGNKRMAKTARASIWKIGVPQVVYMALGAALYAGLSIATNFIQL